MGVGLDRAPDQPQRAEAARSAAPASGAPPAPAARPTPTPPEPGLTSDSTGFTPGLERHPSIDPVGVELVDRAEGAVSGTPATTVAPPHQGTPGDDAVSGTPATDVAPPHQTPPTSETPASSGTPSWTTFELPSFAAMPRDVSSIVANAKNLALQQIFAMLDAAYARHIATLRQQQQQDRQDAPVEAAIATAQNQRRAMQALSQAVASGDAVAQQEASRRFAQAAVTP